MKKQEIQQDILNEISNGGGLPWRRPWNIEPAKNALTGHIYRGVNIFFTQHYGEGCREFVTFVQASKNGYKIKKGTRAVPTIFFKMLEKEQSNGKIKKTPFWKNWSVFPVWDLEGYEYIPSEDTETIDAMAKKYIILKNVQQKIKINGIEVIEANSNRALYSPGKNRIVIPANIPDDEEKISTFFHEAVHTTKDLRNYNHDTDHGRAMEELVAEIGASLLCAYAEIDNTYENSKSYIKSWYELIEKRVENFYIAFNQADKAVNQLLYK